jgi:hypothetical protein
MDAVHGTGRCDLWSSLQRCRVQKGVEHSQHVHEDVHGEGESYSASH